MDQERSVTAGLVIILVVLLTILVCMIAISRTGVRFSTFRSATSVSIILPASVLYTAVPVVAAPAN